ncbi:MAG: class I mannose-6-phosphate isomerase [Tannerella sp.]|jgi:mannose-6-phosphate isomerase|nr:class I mannose-6-phosphate isomerase [Tannerella sp.]
MNKSSLKIRSELYPLRFEPILKEVIWGGGDIRPFKGLTSDEKKIGESWELSHVEGNCSVVADGALKGLSIDELIARYGTSLLGKQVMERFGTRFPLLIKFIDARDDLSVQVHPNDELAQTRHNSFGKTEMWYLVKASAEASLLSGFSQQIDAAEYRRRVAEGSFTEVLQRYNVKAGDVFFLPAGRVHAIGAGCFIAEIQQTSNITYRIYDYQRRDANGNERELHTDLACEAIDYQVYHDYRTHYTHLPDCPVNIAKCKYFTVNMLEISKPYANNMTTLDTFIIYICIQGGAVISDNNGNETTLRQGQTVLVPASTASVIITPFDEAKLLEVMIN